MLNYPDFKRNFCSTKIKSLYKKFVFDSKRQMKLLAFYDQFFGKRSFYEYLASVLICLNILIENFTLKYKIDVILTTQLKTLCYENEIDQNLLQLNIKFKFLL